MNPEGHWYRLNAPFFTGDAGSGESEIRKWIIENDWLECIVSLPDRMFFRHRITFGLLRIRNHPIVKVGSMDRRISFSTTEKNLGDKSKYINDEQPFEIYQNNKENEFCKIYLIISWIH